MIVSLGKFNLRGRYEGHSCEVVRKGDMLVLTFINNAVVAFHLIPVGDGTYSMHIRHIEAFILREDEMIELSLYSDWNVANICLHLAFGTMSFYMDVGVKSSVSCHFFGERRQVIDGAVYMSWLTSKSVRVPVGLCFSGNNSVRTFGWDYKIRKNVTIVIFPNKMAFPIVKTPFGVRIVKTDICFADDIRNVFIRTNHYSKDFIDFRLILQSGDNFVYFDSIRVDADGATYKRGRLSSGEVAKLMLLSGGTDA